MDTLYILRIQSCSVFKTCLFFSVFLIPDHDSFITDMGKLRIVRPIACLGKLYLITGLTGANRIKGYIFGGVKTSVLVNAVYNDGLSRKFTDGYVRNAHVAWIDLAIIPFNAIKVSIFYLLSTGIGGTALKVHIWIGITKPCHIGSALCISDPRLYIQIGRIHRTGQGYGFSKLTGGFIKFCSLYHHCRCQL